jgi:hypothetical protein
MKASSIRIYAILVLALIQWLGSSPRASAQAVAVTMRLDTNLVTVGQGTTLHISAQVVPGLRPTSDRIFSWYVNVLNTNGAAVGANYNSMLKTASDNDPSLSSKGVNSGANRFAIYDTFLNLPGAGVANPVELMSIPVTALAGGKTRFLVQAGSGASLSSDFQVAPTGGGAAYVGGDYSAAFADLSVTSSIPCALNLLVTPLAGGGRPGGTFQLSFSPCPNYTHTVESRAALGDVIGWQALPGAPHNSGVVIITNTGPARFYRVHATSP